MWAPRNPTGCDSRRLIFLESCSIRVSAGSLKPLPGCGGDEALSAPLSAPAQRQLQRILSFLERDEIIAVGTGSPSLLAAHRELKGTSGPDCPGAGGRSPCDEPVSLQEPLPPGADVTFCRRCPELWLRLPGGPQVPGAPSRSRAAPSPGGRLGGPVPVEAPGNVGVNFRWKQTGLSLSIQKKRDDCHAE